tara:strand:+ start:292 stop:504 length:213 start_codon:yes stop_codon:yes gene_type:complete
VVEVVEQVIVLQEGLAQVMVELEALAVAVELIKTLLELEVLQQQTLFLDLAVVVHYILLVILEVEVVLVK